MQRSVISRLRRLSASERERLKRATLSLFRRAELKTATKEVEAQDRSAEPLADGDLRQLILHLWNSFENLERRIARLEARLPSRRRGADIKAPLYAVAVAIIVFAYSPSPSDLDHDHIYESVSEEMMRVWVYGPKWRPCATARALKLPINQTTCPPVVKT